MTDTLSFEAAKAIYNSSNNKEVLEALETVFPQLRENEDEKIRKEILHFIKKRNSSGCDYDYDKWIAWLEKQGEMSKMCPTSVQDEQQPIDKVEPKFKVGNWIIHQGTENIYQVVSRIDNRYQLKYGDNYTIQKCADVDKDVRLWTIDDVKVGNLVTDMHNVLNGYYSNDNDKKKAIRNMVKKIFEAGYSEGYKIAGYNEQGY